MSSDSAVTAASEATLQVGWGQRVLGLFVLGVVIAAIVGLRFDMPWLTWLILGLVGAASTASTISNFGDRVHCGEAGIRRENIVLAALGWRRVNSVAWSEISTAVELDGKTLFLTIEGRPKWVLDSLDGIEDLRALLQHHGVSVTIRRRPRLRDLGRGANEPRT